MTARADYLLVVEHGTLSTGDEALRYVTELETAAQRFHLRRLLVDARSETDPVESRGDARGAMWRWIRTQRAFDLIGYVLRDEMTIARVNMTALSERLQVRAFGAVADGHRWLARARPSSTAIHAVRPVPSSVPPPPMTARTPLPARAPTPSSALLRASSELRSSRLTGRISAVSAEEADAALASRSEAPPSGEAARKTVKIAVVDSKAAEQVLRRTSEEPPKPTR